MEADAEILELHRGRCGGNERGDTSTQLVSMHWTFVVLTPLAPHVAVQPKELVVWHW